MPGNMAATAEQRVGFGAFRAEVSLTEEDICRDYFRENRATLKIKKEAVAVPNLAAFVNATLKLSSAVGFDAMSLRDLCSESGLSMGALYAYFSSKDELLTMIQRQGQATVKRILAERIDHIRDPLPRLRVAIRSHLYLSELLHQWFYFFFMETKNLKKQNRTIPIESELYTERIITDILTAGRDEGVFSVENIELTGAVIKAMLQDWYLKRWKYSQRKVTVDEYASFVEGFVESAIVRERAPNGGERP